MLQRDVFFVKFFLGDKAPVFRKKWINACSLYFRCHHWHFSTPVRPYSVWREFCFPGAVLNFLYFFSGRQGCKLCPSATHTMWIKLVVSQHYVTPSMLPNRNQTSNSFNPLSEVSVMITIGLIRAQNSYIATVTYSCFPVPQTLRNHRQMSQPAHTAPRVSKWNGIQYQSAKEMETSPHTSLTCLTAQGLIY